MNARGVVVVLAMGVMAGVWLRQAQAGPAIESFRTEQGVPVYFVAARDLPIVDLRISFAAGSARDGERPGLAALTARLLSEGARDLSAREIHESFAALGIEYDFDVSRDTAWFSLRMLSDPQTGEAGVALLARILSTPTFADDALRRERARQIRAVQQRRESPASRADDAFYRALYGRHPYGTPSEGEQAALERITAAQVRDFHGRYYLTGNASLALVGDLDEGIARRLSSLLTKTLPAGPAAPPIATPNAPAEGRWLRLKHASTQTHIRMGGLGIEVDDEDYFPLYVGNHVLGGGGFVSRLVDEVREQRGLSYSVYSYFFPLAQPGPFIAGAATRNDQAEEALAAVRDTISTFIREGPTSEELRRAKQNIVGGFPLRFDSNAKLLSYVAMIGFYGLPLDYLDRFPERVEAVSIADVKRAFQRRIKPEGFVNVVVGGGELPDAQPGG